jgi:hypothetical protein
MMCLELNELFIYVEVIIVIISNLTIISPYYSLDIRIKERRSQIDTIVISFY